MGREVDELWESDRRHVWHPYTRRSAVEAGPFPFIVRGEGSWLIDRDGRRYFDAIASWWCCNLGHGHPRVVEAIAAQAARLPHSILGNLSHPAAVELAARLAALMPDPAVHVHFASDGASAVEAALKIAVQYAYNRGDRRRTRFASLRYAYHGDTLGAVSLGFLPAFHAPFREVVRPVYQAEAPCLRSCGTGPEAGDCGLACFESMDRILREHGPELAAVVVEPLCQGAGGMRIYSPRYLQRTAERCREAGVPLIVDEIAMGFGRTGRMFAFEHAGIRPDIVCLGKGLSAGALPISATVVRDEIYATFGDRPEDHTFYHGHTFAGNPIAAAAALATLDAYAAEEIVAQAAAGGARLAAAVAPLRGRSRVRDVRTLGMIAAVELGEAAGDALGPELARQVRVRLLEQGVLLRPLGPVVYLMPPLNTPPAELDRAAALFVEAVGGLAGKGL